MICRGGPLDDILFELEYGRPLHVSGKHTGGYSKDYEICRFFATDKHYISGVISYNPVCFRKRNTIVRTKYEKEWLRKHPHIAWRIVGYESKGGKPLRWAVDEAMSFSAENELFIKGKPNTCPCFQHVDVFIKIKAIPKIAPMIRVPDATGKNVILEEMIYKDEGGRRFIAPRVGLDSQKEAYCIVFGEYITRKKESFINANKNIIKFTNRRRSLKSDTTVYGRVSKADEEKHWTRITDWSWGGV